jgi:hypothetical protein
MSRDPICDFVLSITTSNAVGWDKNVKTIFQEGVLRKWAVAPTKSEENTELRIEDFRLKCTK